ncbi:protein midgut expression 1 [Drosophila madeirensis]|uniref:Protein midgut expression 1 n=1 Tax=Drosophila madeirensis TaxID=30013 RepID=A0AAU9FL03_DROMD|nr:protein midgut expression 1 [Drosophila guanche]XP_034140367.1 protein midgut expression 1 [Drosophila guanche]XP_034656150.1 protein midgut expression 1 [Drosophila subobscura]
MCNALCECLKCPGKVVCCCCSCACKMLMSIFCSVIVLLVVIGLIVYFTVYYHKDKDTKDIQQQVSQLTPIVKRSIRDYFNKEY